MECPKNTYRNVRGAMSCTPCPDNKLSPRGSEKKSSCSSSGEFLAKLHSFRPCVLQHYYYTNNLRMSNMYASPVLPQNMQL